MRDCLLLLTLLAALAAVLYYVPPVRGQRDVASELVVKAGIVSFNEALDSYPDAGLIVQVLEGHGATPRDQLAWLTRHSPCATGRLSQEQALARPGNCGWSRNLTEAGTLPAFWPYERGIWGRLRLRWLDHVSRVRDLVSGRDRWRPCPDEQPQTWDGVRYGRERVAPEGGARRILDCEPPYVRPGSPREGLHNYAVRYGQPDGA